MRRAVKKKKELEMWANAQRDGRPAEYRWRPLFIAAVWLTPTTRVPCSNAAKTRNQLKLPGVPQTNETISAASGPKFTILWGHLEEILLLNKFFTIVDTFLSCEDIARQSCGMVPRWRFLAPDGILPGAKFTLRPSVAFSYILAEFSCEMHFKHIITVSSQRLNILKILKRQGLRLELLHCVFHAIIYGRPM